MARRDIPEINAGSMADIAFLLLIFFLVTTTMDKDQAYLRDIPKKVLVPPTEIVKVEERNICEIKANDQNQLMMRGKIMENPNEISDGIVEWLTANEKTNDVTNNFPLFSRISMPEIEAGLAEAERDLDETSNTPGASEVLIQYKEKVVQEWVGKKQALALYGKKQLPEIHGQSHIRVVVQKGTHYELFAKIQSEVEEAIHEVRNNAAMELFNESYGVIKRRFSSDKNGEDKSKLDLLKILYPDRIIEVTPRR